LLNVLHPQLPMRPILCLARLCPLYRVEEEAMATISARKASLSFTATFTPLDVDCCRRNLDAFDGASPKPAKSRAIADALLFGIPA
jgi:hypothetical protein